MRRTLSTGSGVVRPGPNGTPRSTARRIVTSAERCPYTTALSSGSSSSRIHTSTEEGTGVNLRTAWAARRAFAPGGGAPMRRRIRTAASVSIRPSRKQAAR
ncbi:hypothetical protein [Streptomyces canus]|uniref:hypothetical protein n=1 Tax=Streptomyces canus TaxID=58343 RepID=UPI0036E88DBD